MKVFLAAISLSVIATEAWAAPCLSPDNIVKEDGECWISLTEIEKSFILRGVWAGVGARDEALQLVDQAPNRFVSPDLLAIPDSTSITDLLTYIDTLYEKPANRAIRWKYAYMLATMNARDDDDNDAKQLTKMLRENGGLPVYAKLVRAVSPDAIEVLDSGKMYRIRLAGVTSVDVPVELSEMAEAILESLSTVGLSCEREPHGYINLIYADEFFDDNNDLSAYVSVPTYYSLCIDGNELPISSALRELGRSNSSGRLIVNWYLAYIGLLRKDQHADPSWSSEKKYFRDNLMDITPPVSQHHNTYLHGQERLDWAERASRANKK